MKDTDQGFSRNTSVYLHVPFCRHRCAYCDFNTYAGQFDAIPAYVEALCAEIREVRRLAPDLEVGSIFFGGGTPSLVSLDQYEAIFETIYGCFRIADGAEISLEANPGTVSAEYLAGLRTIGFNRISYGVQSANPEELRMLERIHTFTDVVDALKWSRKAGFENINLDLIYGLPEQSLARWQSTLKLAAGLEPEHISAYALTIEHGTPFGRWAAKGLIPTPDPDLAASQYELAMEFLEQAGYGQYEISNWSKPGLECRHNLQYWRNLDYLGLGAGAHGYADSTRYSNVLRIKTYIDRMRGGGDADRPYPLSGAAVNQHKNSAREDMQDTMLTGLRLTRDGISAEEFAQRFGQHPMEVFGREINALIQSGLLEWVNDRLRLTVRGRLLGNQVFMQFVG